MTLIDLALQNLLSPPVLFFALGLLAAAVRSDLAVPEAVAKLLALYLMMSIGFRGGAEMAHHGLDARMLATIASGAALSFAIPIAAFASLRLISSLSHIDAAAVAAHYGSISAVTLAAVTSTLAQLNIPYEGYLVATAAAMETPAIFSALILAHRSASSGATPLSGSVMREAGLNGSVVMLLGAFIIGALTGDKGLASLKPFILDPFIGFLCLFLLDMGLVAGRNFETGRRHLSIGVIAFAIVMPLANAVVALVVGQALGLSMGGLAVFATLAGSASYIAVPAAMRLALPQANPAIALTLSLCVTFPFNLTLGIPLYLSAARALAS